MPIGVLGTKQAQLALVSVAGWRFGGPIARQVVARIPGLSGLQFTDDIAGAIGAAGAFLIGRRLLK